MNTKRIFYGAALLVSMVLFGCAPTKVETEKTEKPNILFLSIDDLRPELNCYGNSYIHSPNIDNLASNGLMFRRAYCQQAVCGPSRASLMTGLRPDSSFVTDNATHHRDVYIDVVTLPQHFIEHGYHAVNYGKIYHGHMGKFNDAKSWSELWYYPPQNYTRNLRGYLNPKNLLYNKGHKLFNAEATEGEDVEDEAYLDGQTVKTVLQNLPRFKEMAENGKPFFLAVGIEKPHLPFVAPKKYWDLYDRDEIEIPGSNPPENAPQIAQTNWYELRTYTDIDRNATSLSDEKAKQLIHGYRACVSYADALVGKLIQGLKENGLYDNTIIILWGDHGWKLGDYGQWCKHTNYEIDTRVPLIVSAPGFRDKGKVSEALVELVDMYPSLCEMAGIPLAEHLQGDSFLPLLKNSDLKWKEAVFSQYPRTQKDENGKEKKYMGYAMRTPDFRYVKWLETGTKKVYATELYDHRNSNEELENVSGKPAYASIEKEMETKFEEQINQAHLQGKNRVELVQ
jgi:arylsulfatase A-like enzyme